MAALFHRERTGEGQFIDVSLLDSVMPFMGWVVANLMLGGQEPQLLGNDNFTAAPSGTFKTKDGYINIAANKQEQWHAVADILGVPELKEDPRFKERDARKANRFALTPLLEEKLTQNTTKYWVEKLNEAGVPSGEILKLGEALTQPQIEHRQTFSEVSIDGIGQVKLFNLTAKFEKTPGFVKTPPPKLSQHTYEILQGIGYSKEEIDDFKSQGIV
jgi:crotonobetainyl-CoA:carnitine CoA-transferase CaiB-like acyl-CoA transferase